VTDDLVKRLNEDFSVNAREDIHHQMKVYEAERKEAADRIEALEAALRNARARYVELDDKQAAEEMAKIISEALDDECN
jgi:hypothetical protein